MIPEGMKAVNMTMPEELFNDLKAYAEKKHISMAAVIRIACSELIERENEKK